MTEFHWQVFHLISAAFPSKEDDSISQVETLDLVG